MSKMNGRKRAIGEGGYEGVFVSVSIQVRKEMEQKTFWWEVVWVVE
jgi:hypothetical protein